MLAFRSLVAAAAVVAVTGCASVSDPVATSRSELPAWTDKTQFEDEQGARQVFVGIGQAATEAEAKRRARSDAQSQYIRAVGGVVVTSQRVVESSESGADGISQSSVSSERYTGSTSSALLHSTESEYVTHRESGKITVYVRMSVPTKVLEDAQKRVKQQNERAIMRQVEAYRLAHQSREGAVNGNVYAFVVESSSALRKAKMRSISVEREARQKARHQAKIAVAEQVHGVSIKSVSIDSGARIDSSYTSTSGKVQSELIAERVWWEGDAAVAETYMLGWKKQEK